jgi:hypothetical protein
MLPPSFDDNRPPFDHAFASELVGRSVLVGITYVDRQGEIKSQQQFFGTIIKADPHFGFCLVLTGQRAHETYWLAPDTRVLHKASPGEYRLRSTGEVVIDPDYTSTWTVTQPDA